MDEYLSIKRESTGDFRIKASKFLSYAFPVTSEVQIKSILGKIREDHKKANHHCYAYRLFEAEISRSSDDGEPSGTAGKPILGQLVKSDIYDTLIIVVRYFGGTKLGVRGMIDAYQESARLSLESNVTITKYNLSYFEIEGDYSATAFVDRCIQKFNLQVIQESFGVKFLKKLAIPQSLYDETLGKIVQFKKNEFGYDNIADHPVKVIIDEK